MRADIAQIVGREKAAEFYALRVVLGYCYQDSPVVVVDDGTVATWKRSRDYVPQAIPGCLAPHRWLDDTSLYDLFGVGFTLLVLGKGHGDNVASARADAERAGTPLTVVELDDPTSLALYRQPLALIRPDQHVAWRGAAWPAGGMLEIVTGRAPAKVGQPV